MALEISDQAPEEKSGGSLTPEQFKLFTELQERIAQLERGNAPTSPSSSEQYMVKLLEKLTAPTSIDDGTGQFKFNQMHSEEDIDPNDVLSKTEQVTFFCHRVLYPIVDDRRGGKNIPAPLGKIVFKYFTQKRIPNGKETDVINISLYTCKSKKELEWLRKHSMYNVMFFENMNSALSTSVDKASRLAKQIISMQNLGQHDVVQLAKSRGIDMSTDIQAMKLQIAEQVVDEQMKRERSHFEKIIQENEAEAAMLGN